MRHRIGPARAQGFERDLFRPDQQWAIPDEADAARKLRWVFDHRAEAAALGAAQRERLLQNYSAAALTAELLRVAGEA